MDDAVSVKDTATWESLVSAANPASILVVISARMGPQLRSHLGPEDIMQEALLKAWQARSELAWQGMPAFRKWLIRIAERCIEDQRDYHGALKRSQRPTGPMGSANADHSHSGSGVDPWTSTTPSRIASAREHAGAMERALAQVPIELRDIVHLRLFEELPIHEIATRLGLGESAVRHRFRRGAEMYRDGLRRFMASSSTGQT